ncbi:hypothetical protein BH11PLA2_BH11PLA2_03920 [soil metagenome]
MFQLLLLTACLAPAQASPKPTYLYGHDLKVRNVGAKNFDATTPKVGVEFFHDTIGNTIVAISEAGHIAVIPFTTAGDQKKAEWLSAFELRVRPAGVEKWSESKQYAAETFKDTASGKLLHITNLKTIAMTDMAAKPETDKEPSRHHALELKVRNPGEEDFKSAKKIGLEIFRDGTTGGLVYISENGFLTFAPAPTKAPEPDALKAPKALHGLSLQARKADEGNFTKDTKAYGLEVFSDPNSGATLYISETGSIAAIPEGKVATGQGVKWSHSFSLKARKAGEKDFEKAAKYGIEVFEDKNTGALIYISEVGSIAVKK